MTNGKNILVRTATLFLATAALAQAQMEFYEQKIEIVLSNAASAAKAKVTIRPLHNGKKWAVTCRWDDNNVFNAKLSSLMKQYGIRGTFYLNGAAFYLNKTSGLKDETDRGREAVKHEVSDIVADGNSIGSHGWTHPMLGMMSANRIFEELMRNRVQLEEISDAPVLSHAFSFMSWGNNFDYVGSRKMVGESLLRAGLYSLGESLHHDSYDWPFQMPSPYYVSSDYVAPEKVGENIAKLLANSKSRETEPCMAFSIHPGAHQNPEVEGRCFGLVAKHPDYWFCTQDEYGAYRIQRRATQITASVTGNVLRVVLSRPTVEHLNNAIPLTLAVDGVEADSVREIRAGGSAVERLDTGNVACFNLPHDRSQTLPSKIDWIANEDNESSLNAATFLSKDFPGLSGIVWREGDHLKWIFRNGTGTELTDIRAICRLPVGFKNRNKTVTFPALPGHAELAQTEPLSPSDDDPEHLWGNGFFDIELSFLQGEIKGRLHLTASVKNTVLLDESFPNNNFLRIGPIPYDEYVPRMAEDIASGKTNAVVLKKGSVLKAGPIDFANRPLNPADLHPETVFTTGRFSLGAYSQGDAGKYAGVWIYRSTLVSEKQEDAIFTPMIYWLPTYNLNPKTVYVNGTKLEADGRFTLNAGKNDLIIVYRTFTSGDALSQQNAAFFCKIISRHATRPSWSEPVPRIKTVRYTLPSVL